MTTTSTLSRRSIMTAVATIGAAAAVPALAEQVPVEATPPALAADTIDRAGMVARAEQIVDVLSDRHVREGWHESFDSRRAAQFVESVGRFDENDGECEHFRTMLDWMREHGQSFDWLLDGDASGMICEGAKASARVAEPDPIFRLIKSWREALAFSNRAFDNEAAEQAALDEENRAMKAVLSAVPTTLEGMRAKIDFVTKTDFESNHVAGHLRHSCTDDTLNNFLETLYDGARLIAREA